MSLQSKSVANREEYSLKQNLGISAELRPELCRYPGEIEEQSNKYRIAIYEWLNG